MSELAKAISYEVHYQHLCHYFIEYSREAYIADREREAAREREEMAALIDYDQLAFAVFLEGQYQEHTQRLGGQGLPKSLWFLLFSAVHLGTELP